MVHDRIADRVSPHSPIIYTSASFLQLSWEYHQVPCVINCSLIGSTFSQLMDDNVGL